MDIQKYIWCFVIGGIICAIGQILLDKTKLTSARILVLFVTIGAILSGLNLYQPLVDLRRGWRHSSSYRLWSFSSKGYNKSS